MDDDNTKEEEPRPTTSKKESQRVSSGHEIYNDERGRDDQGTNSESSVSATYSARSRLDIDDVRSDVPKAPALGMKREQKRQERKKRGRRAAGRIEKRRRSGTRRHAIRRPPKRRSKQKQDKKIRSLSVSTIFTRLSSGSRTPGCIHCGHRCCRRRYEYEIRMERIARMKRRRPRRPKRIIKRRRRKVMTSGLEANQIGSRCLMLSPLFMNTSLPGPEEDLEPLLHVEVSPEMIYESLRRLTMWRETVMTESILDDMKKNYPVNPDEVKLIQELREKLRVASVVGIITMIDEERWSLTYPFQKRKLTKSHVTRFWKIYGDTMRPVTKKYIDPEEKAERSENETNTERKNASFVS